MVLDLYLNQEYNMIVSEDNKLYLYGKDKRQDVLSCLGGLEDMSHLLETVNTCINYMSKEK